MPFRKVAVAIVGAGPAGLFAAQRLKEQGQSNLVVLEKGRKVERRLCRAEKRSSLSCAAACSPCNITSGVGGGGAFSDGKWNVDDTFVSPWRKGLWKEGYVNDLRQRFYEVLKLFGASYEVYPKDEDNGNFNELRREVSSAGISNLYLQAKSKVLHFGTQRMREFIFSMQSELFEPEQLITGASVTQVTKGQDNYRLSLSNGEGFVAKCVIWATGRSGDREFRELITNFPDIETYLEPALIGARVVVPYNVLSRFTKAIWAPCFSASEIPFAPDSTFTFCTCPNGKVVTEKSGFVSANGESSPEFSSGETNFALLTTVPHQKGGLEPNQLVREWAGNVNRLSGGIYSTSLGEIVGGASLIYSAYPSYVIDRIVTHLQKMDRVAPGVASDRTMLHFPEVKLRGRRTSTNPFMETGQKGFFVAGDVGISNNLYDAALTGMAAADGTFQHM